jgi:hypothetical protein
VVEAVSIIVKATGVYVMVISAVLLRMPKAIVETNPLPEKCIAIPYVGIVITHAVICIKNTNPIRPYANIS